MSQNAAIDPDAIRRRAHQRWLERGCPTGSPEQDWLAAEHELAIEMEQPARARSLGTTVVTPGAAGLGLRSPSQPRAPRTIVTRAAGAPAARLLVALVPDATRSVGGTQLPPVPRPRRR